VRERIKVCVYTHKSVAVFFFSVLQFREREIIKVCVYAHTRVLQCVAVCCSVMQCVAMTCEGDK